MSKEANNKSDKILNSLNGIKRMQAPDFFYTRLKAKMLAEETSPSVKQNNRILRPVYAIAFLALLIAFNFISLLKQSNEQSNTVNADENSQTIASAYHLDDNLSYDLNQ